MIYLKCECGNGIGVPGSFLGEVVPCDDCGRSSRLVAARQLDDGDTVRWRLHVRRAPADIVANEQIFLGGNAAITVGKGDDKHLLLPGTLVSRAHCRLVPDDDGGWQIEDTNSRNGVFVNGARITTQSLKSGDVIRIGEYELEYRRAGETAVATPVPEPVGESDDDAYGEYDFAEPVAPPAPRPSPAFIPTARRAAAVVVDPTRQLGAGPTCPSCRKTLVHGAKICVECGIDIRSGRPLLTAQGLDEDTLYVRAENAIRLISWLVPFGLYPVASEARGHSKPYAVWTIAALTLLASFVFFAFLWTAPDDELPAGSNLMLWVGDAHALDEFALDDVDKPSDKLSRAEAQRMIQDLLRRMRPTEEFHAYQLLTHALLHGDLLHIAGNMLFLMVFGTRVNALLGNLKTAIIYPALAIAGGVGHLLASRHEFPSPMLGASGAIMGLAGMYLVLFPVYRVHMAIWMRFGLFTGFKLAWKLFALRGFWVVLFYIAFDVLATVLGSEDHVAHWAHLGGFIVGALLALALLLTRVVNAHGGDLLSVLLGRWAWHLLGKPTRYASGPVTS
jgi:membrane associated rhomboid family serine protease/pSer/pThr/pTyr-binding forkhead associated (FHA) protein